MTEQECIDFQVAQYSRMLSFCPWHEAACLALCAVASLPLLDIIAYVLSTCYE